MDKGKFATKAVHSGQHPDPSTGAVSVPIYASSTFVFQNAEQGAARFAGKETGYIYSRLGNPTVRALEESIAALEGAEDARASASGMAAISTAAMAICKSSDHILAGDALYGGTHKVFTDILKGYGVGCTLVDTSDLAAVEKAIKPNTKLIYIETPSNPLMKLTDMKAIAKIAKAHGITTVADNTFMSPYLQRPIEHGVDVVVHSITKSLSGHSDVVGGAIVGTKAFLKAMDPMYKNMGATLGPFEAWLTLRGIKTLHVRMQRQTESAEKIAKWLEDHPKVEWVKYPGLKSHPQHTLAKRQMDGFGSMMSFEVKGGVEAGRKVMNNVKLCGLAVSLGAVETLICHPPTMTHAVVPKEDRIKAGISDGLVRFSVGIEDIDDIIADLDQALAKA
ncbi:TPA: PLP-dependent transferase [Candidatus Bathyarchaeota archaeon]|nr:PLP-dependent transferase [Candidatus Bathyarchaeota archaeon]